MRRDTEAAAPTDRLLSVREVADRFFVTPAAVYKWIERGKLGALRTPGGGILGIPESTLLEFTRPRGLAELSPKVASAVMPAPASGTINRPGEISASAVVIENLKEGRYHTIPQRRYNPEHARLLAEMEGAAGGWENEERYGTEYPEGFVRRRPFRDR